MFVKALPAMTLIEKKDQRKTIQGWTAFVPVFDVT
jgi:hypothetical protein